MWCPRFYITLQYSHLLYVSTYSLDWMLFTLFFSVLFFLPSSEINLLDLFVPLLFY